jgi:hypothetical protein
MRKALNITFIVAGMLVYVMTSRGMTVADTRATAWPARNTAVIHGLHVALPSQMKNFPPERVPLP